MDLIGMASFIFPGMGEFADVIWAPISGYIFFKLFGGRLGVIGGVLDFLEEIIPFTDIIPSFTIAWLLRRRAIGKMALKHEKFMQKHGAAKSTMKI
jgi:hypothetical protein